VCVSGCQRFAVKSSLFANNSATSGGAIYVDKSSTISIGGSLPLVYSIACQTCSNRPISTSESFEFQSVLLSTPSYIMFGSNVNLQYLRGLYVPGSMSPNWITKVESVNGNLPGMNGEPPLLFSERDYLTFFVNSVFNSFLMTVFPVDIDDISTIPTKTFESYTVVECLTHPYRHSELIYSEKIAFGSSMYRLEFDYETTTELSYDVLTVHRGTPLGEVLYSNSGNDWPTVTVESPDGIIISFYSDDSVSFWGFKVTISASSSSPTTGPTPRPTTRPTPIPTTTSTVYSSDDDNDDDNDDDGNYNSYTLMQRRLQSIDFLSYQSCKCSQLSEKLFTY
jgi:predicted outer membrane repeat protein